MGLTADAIGAMLGAMRLRSLALLASVLPASVLASGCYDSSSSDEDGGGIVLMRDVGPPGGFDAGTPPPPVDAGRPPPPPPMRDGGGPRVRPDGSFPTREGAVGAACASDADCTEVDMAMCQTTVGGGGFGFTFPGGYCTRECASDGDCGEGAECFMVGFGGFGFAFCAKACSTDDECRADEGYTCAEPPFIGMGATYCLPPMGGPGGSDASFMLPDASFSLPDASLPDASLPDAGP